MSETTKPRQIVEWCLDCDATFTSILAANAHIDATDHVTSVKDPKRRAPTPDTTRDTAP